MWLADLEDGVVPKAAKPTAVELEGSVSTVTFSPSGESLAVSVAPTPSIDDHYMKRKVHILDATSGAVTGKLDTEGKIGRARYSPAGDRIAMIASADLNDPSTGRLMVGSGEGGALEPVLPLDAEEHVTDFDWLDDDTLVFLSDRGVQTVVGTVGADGSNPTVLAGPAGPVFWRLSVSRATKRAALVGDTPAFPAEVYAADLESPGAAKRVTTHNTWLNDIQLGRQEAVTYTARDGLELGGVLVHPAVKPPEPGRAPLVLVVHGGPESHVKNGWVTSYSRPGQTGAAKGWAVFYPNYRGSTGRGVAFSKMGQSDYAGAEFDDLVDAITHFDAQGLIDTKKVGITGGSYGGFASAWGAT
ncbi:MAG: LpqB family beta-propeller domain-containing protein, partial [Myxococcota bacterium]|nr:LpqB family beta-propeller domain-containing protein [Myxococcota bacterium]